MRRRLLSALLLALSFTLLLGGAVNARVPEPVSRLPRIGVRAPAAPGGGGGALQPGLAAAAGAGVALGEPGLSFRYVQTFGVTGEPYPADAAHLNGPGGLCVDESGSVYVIEESGLRLFKFTSSGTNTLIIGQAGRPWHHDDYLAWPKDVAVEPGTGHIWATISSALKEFDDSGAPIRRYPDDEPWASGDADNRFDDPRGLAFDGAGQLYVADTQNHRIQVFDVAGEMPALIDTIGVSGVPKDDNTGFNQPTNVAFDSMGRLYVLDTANYRVQRCTYSGGAWNCSTFYGVTGVPGSDLIHMEWAFGLTVDGSDNLYVADSGNYRVLKCSAAGGCSHLAGVTGVPGPGDDRFLWPSDVAVDSSGNVYVSDFNGNRVKMLSSSGNLIRTLGQTGVPYVLDTARINAPWGVAVAGDGSIYVAETRGYRLLKLNAAGAQKWTVGQAGVWGADNAHLGDFWAGPEGSVALDAAGRVYVSDTANHRVQVFTAAGSHYGTFGSYGSGPNELSGPRGVAIDPANGDIYVVDADNHRIQVFSSAWGYKATLGVTGEAGSDNAHLSWPLSVAVDADGQIYVADSENLRVQKCTLTGSGYSCSTFAGETGVFGDDLGHLHPTGVAVDRAGRVYVTDDWNSRVQVFDAAGAYLTSIAGWWGNGSGQFANPMGVAVDGEDNVYVSDLDNHRIQKFAPGVPGWRQVNINGFGERGNSLTSLAPFGGRLYAGTENGDGAQLWWMDASGAWTQIMAGGFGLPTNTAIDHLFEFNGQLYAGTWTDGGNGGQIWRSASGDSGSWQPVISDGFGDPSNSEVFRFAIFGNQLYAATFSVSDEHGGEVWRSPSGDAGDWQRVVSDGFGDAGNVVALSLETFGNHLYAGTWGTSGEVWRSASGNAGSWRQVNLDGFGDASNVAVSGLAAFNGCLYASTLTRSGTGAQVWRCQACDGSDWFRVMDDGWGNADRRGMNALEVLGDHLYFVVGNRETGLEVWRTENGTAWEQVGEAGFGDSNNYAPYWDNAVTTWGGQLYVGTMNDAQGGEVWTLLPEPGGLPLVQVTTDPAEDSDPAITQLADGRLWAVWSSNRSAGPGLWSKTSSSNGAIWSAEVRLTSGWDEDPAIMQDASGRLWLVWSSWRSGNYDIWYKTSSDGGNTWTVDRQLTTAGADGTQPAIVQADDGRVVVAWCEAMDLYFVSSTDGGTTWGAFRKITNDYWLQRAPTMAREADGTLWLVWQDDLAGHRSLLFSKSTDNGVTWTAPAPLSISPLDASSMSLLVRADGEAWLAWSDGATDSSIWFANSSDHGITWSAPTRFTSFVGTDRDPSLARLSDGSVGLVWVSDRSGNRDIWFGIPGEREDIDPPPYVALTGLTPWPNPVEGDTITLFAIVRDETGLAHVELVWTLNGAAQPDLKMYDDGSHGDDTAGDGVYTVQCAPLAVGSQVTYRTRATDTDGNVFLSSWENHFQVLTRFVRSARVLLVVDQLGGNTDSFRPYYTTALEATGRAYDVWDTTLRGVPGRAILNQYLDGAVIWATPQYGLLSYTSGANSELRAFLDAGGRLFVSGQDVAYYLDSYDADLLTDYLHATYVQDDSGLYGLAGMVGDPIGDGLALNISGGDGANNQTWKDVINPIAPAVPVFAYAGSSTPLAAPAAPEAARPEPSVGKDGRSLQHEGVPRHPQPSAGTAPGVNGGGTAALRVDTGTYKLVYFAFGFEAINSAADRTLVMDRVLNWLGISAAPPEVVYVGSADACSGHSPCYGSIQAGIKAVAPGGTVNILGGTWAANLTIEKPLTLQGQGPDNTIINSSMPNNCIIGVKAGGRSASEHLVIKDLKLNGASGNGSPAIWLTDQASHVTIENVAMTYNNGPGLVMGATGAIQDVRIVNCTFAHNMTGLSVGPEGSVAGLSISGSRFEDNACYGLNVAGHGGTSGLTLSDSTFAGNGVAGASCQSSAGIMLWGFGGDATLSDVDIDGTGALYGLQINGEWQQPARPLGNVALSGVRISGSPLQAGLALGHYSDASRLSVSDLSIDVDLSSGRDPWGNRRAALYMADVASPTAIDLANTRLAGRRGIDPRDPAGRPFDLCASLADVDARHVTFGAAGMLAIENLVYHQLDEAWLGLVTWDDENVYVTQDSGSIQRGINAVAAGGTVHVGPGTYEEPLITIKKPLTVRSTAGRNDTHIANTSGSPNVIVVTSSGVTIDGLTISGASGVAGAEGAQLYVRSEDGSRLSGVAVRRCRFIPYDMKALAIHGASNCSVEDSGFEGHASPGVAMPLLEIAEVSELSVTGNAFTGNMGGVAVPGSADGYGDSIGVRLYHNSFAGSASPAVRNDVTSQIDASGNWWGSLRGPAHSSNPGGTELAVAGNVAFSPWLGDGMDTEPSTPGFQPKSWPTYGIPTRLAFSTQPREASQGQPLAPQPVVRAEDGSGNLGINFQGEVTIAIASGPSGSTLTGKNPVAAIDGVATFTDLAIAGPSGSFTLEASAAGLASAATNLDAPATPAGPNPQDGELNVRIDKALAWAPAARATSYDIRLWQDGQERPGEPTAAGIHTTSYKPAALLRPSTLFHWDIVAHSSLGSTQGPVWSFSTESLPNLSVAVTAPPSAFSGQPMELSWLVTNAGSRGTTVTNWYDRVYISPSSTFDLAAATYLGQVANPAYLAPGESYRQEATFTLPKGLSGPCYAFVLADGGGAMRESDEADNTGVSSAITVSLTPPPDLRVTALTGPANAFSGAAIPVNWTVANSGAGETIASNWRDRLYLSADAALDISRDTLLNTITHAGALDAGGSYTVTLQSTLPQAIFGDYYLFVVTDALDQVYEHAGEGNNTSEPSAPIAITLTPPPDLEVVSVDVPAAVSSGSRLEVTWQVENNGPGAPFETLWQDRVYLSSSAVFTTTGATVLGTFNHTGTLEAGASYSMSPEFTLPNGMAGTYYVHVWTDYANKVFEFGADGNNTASSQPLEISLTPPPDLQVSSVSTPVTTTVVAGSAIQVEWTIANGGSGAADASWRDQVYLSTSDRWPGSGILLDTAVRPAPLAPGAEYTQTRTMILPGSLAANDYYIYVLADAGNVIYEYNAEINNTGRSSAPISVAAAPASTPTDLVLGGVQGPNSGASGAAISVTWTVTNSASTATKASSWSDAVYLSDDSTLDPAVDTRLGTAVRSGALAAGSSYTRTLTANLPNGIEGQRFLIVRNDLYSQVNDDDRTNNIVCLAQPVDIALTPSPDLRPTPVDAVAEAVAGQPLDVTWAVANEGAGAAAGNWYDAIYLSADALVDASDTILATRLHGGGLAANASYTATVTVTVPSGASGIYYMLLKADVRNDVYEHQAEDNNVAAWPVSIVVPPPADLVVTSVTVPTDAVPGQPITIEWTVENQGSVPVKGTMCDAVFISADPSWDIDDAHLGDSCRSVDLAPQEAIQMQMSARMPARSVLAALSSHLTGNLPGVIPGAYYAVVRTDIRNQMRESDETNNAAASANAILVDVDTLTLGTPAQGSLGAGEAHFYRVDVTAGETLLVSLDSASTAAANELYVRFGQAPSRGNFDYGFTIALAPDQEVVVPATREGTYYILAYGASAPDGAQPFGIVARYIQFAVQAIDLQRTGNTGPVSFIIQGAQFDDATTFEVVDASGRSIASSKHVLLDSTRAIATFDLAGAAPGLADIRATKASLTATLEDALSIEAGLMGRLDIHLEAPSSLRPGQMGTWYVNYGNTGFADVDVPVLLLRLPGISHLSFEPQGEDLGDTVLILGLPDDPLYTSLRPGEYVRLPFYGQLTGTVDGFLTAASPQSSLFASISIDYDQLLSQAPGDPSQDWQDYLNDLRIEYGDSLAQFYADALSELDEMVSDGVYYRSVRHIDGVWLLDAYDSQAGEATLSLVSPCYEHSAAPDRTSCPPSGHSAEGIASAASPSVAFAIPSTGYLGLTWTGDGKGQHRGIDIWTGPMSSSCGCAAGADCQKAPGKEMHAARAGTVAAIYWGDHNGAWAPKAADNPNNYPLSVVILKHTDVPGIPGDVYTVYEHMANDTTNDSYVDDHLYVGKPVLQGEVLGRQGNWRYYADNDPITHLHFEVAFLPTSGDLSARVTKDPLPYLGLTGAVCGTRMEAAGPSTSGTQRTYVIIITDEDYTGQDPNHRKDLPESARDGRTVYDYFHRFLGLPDTQIMRVHDGLGDNNMNVGADNTLDRQDILDAISRSPADSDDTLVIYYSGHGLVGSGDWSLNGGTMDAATLSQAIANKRVADSYVISESCIAGSFINAITSRTASLAASDGDTVSHAASGPLGLGKNGSSYTNELMKYLRQGYTLEDAHRRAAKAVESMYARRSDLFIDGQRVASDKQRPTMLNRDGLDTHHPWIDPISFSKSLFRLADDILANIDLQEACSQSDLGPCQYTHTAVVRSVDPNDIVGPVGYGDAHWVPSDASLGYTIRFENDETQATAPARRIMIEQTLDEDLDPRAFRLGSFGFGGRVFEVPANRSYHQARLDLVSEIGLYVDVTAGIDVVSGKAFWALQSIDPATGAPPTDASKGFLPPDIVEGQGQGFVSYVVTPKTGLASGTVIDAQARIVFDNNAPIDTPPIFNTLDAGRPTSSLSSLPEVSDGGEIVLTWQAADGAAESGLRSVDLYVSDNGAPFALAQAGITDMHSVFRGGNGHTYGFFTLATDNAGNREVQKTTAEASTRIEVNATPVLDTIDPSAVTAGNGAFTLTVNGSDFVPASQILWDDTPLATSYVSATQLTAQVSADAVASAGTASITVRNPEPGGDSEAKTFTVRPVPSSVYVDAAWVGVATDADPDGAGPATHMGYDAFSTIEPAVDAVAPGGTVSILGGTWAANLTIKKSLALRSTAGYNNTRIDNADGSPNTIVVASSGVTIDGLTISSTSGVAGADKDAALFIRSEDGSPLSDIAVRNCRFIPSDRRALAIHGASSCTVADNVFEGQASSPDAATKALLEIAEVEGLSASGNAFTGNMAGVAVLGSAEGYGDSTGVRLHHNSFAGSASPAVRNGAATAVDAMHNWWGSLRGAAHSSNPGGNGLMVSDNVAFSPWLGDGMDIEPSTPGFQPKSWPIYAIPTRLAFSTQPGGARQGQPLAPQPVVRAEDDSGNLGINFQGEVTIAIESGPGGSVLAGTNPVTAVDGVARFRDLAIETPGSGYTLMASAEGLDPASSDSFRVEASEQIVLVKGWNLVSLPVAPTSGVPADVLSSIAGKFDLVYAYDAADTADPWKLYNPASPDTSDLSEIDETMGLWVHTNQAATLFVDGSEAAGVPIPLRTGWNLVGYPRLTGQAVADALESIKGKYDLVYAYDVNQAGEPWQKHNPALPDLLNDLATMAPGKGYWIHVTEACTWTVP